MKCNDFYTNRFVKTGQSASIDSNQVSPQDGVQLGSRKISLSLSAESIKQFLTPVSFQLTRLEMITSSLTRLDGNFIPVARTWWQLKSLSPTVLKTRFVHALSPSPLSPSTTVRHHFDNLIIRYRYANNRRTRYSPLANREDREITRFSYPYPSPSTPSFVLSPYSPDKIHPPSKKVKASARKNDYPIRLDFYFG